MILGRVIGQVVPCIVTPGLEGVPMLLVQPLDKTLKPKGKAIVAAEPGLTQQIGALHSCLLEA